MYALFVYLLICLSIYSPEFLFYVLLFFVIMGVSILNFPKRDKKSKSFLSYLNFLLQKVINFEEDP